MGGLIQNLDKLLNILYNIGNKYMAEDFSKNSIEAEIAELSQKIAEKRKQLESRSGVVEERDLVKSATIEQIGQNSTPPVASNDITPKSDTQKSQAKTVVFDPASGKSYLDYLDEESRDRVTTLVGVAFEKGIKEAIKQAKTEEPFILDAFHDVLRDKVFKEIKDRGIIR